MSKRSRPRRLNPASTCSKFPRVRTNRPVLTRSTSDSAIWTTISVWLSRERPPAPSVRAPPWNCVARSTRVARSAGARPNSSAVVTVTAMVKPRTRASSGMSSTTAVLPNGLRASSNPRLHQAMAVPSAAPPKASRRDSAKSCLTMRPGLAPSASRKAMSRRRAVARASSRFATLAQAAANTRPTRPISIWSGLAKRRRASFSP